MSIDLISEYRRYRAIKTLKRLRMVKEVREINLLKGALKGVYVKRKTLEAIPAEAK